MPVQSMMSALVIDEVERLVVGDAGRLAHAVAQHLAAAELALVAVDREVALDLGDERGVAEPDAIAGRRAVDLRVVPPIDAPVMSALLLVREATRPAAPRRRRPSSLTGPLASALPPRTIRRPAIATSCTVCVSPGSKRTAVPAGMSRRMP